MVLSNYSIYQQKAYIMQSIEKEPQDIAFFSWKMAKNTKKSKNAHSGPLWVKNYLSGALFDLRIGFPTLKLVEIEGKLIFLTLFWNFWTLLITDGGEMRGEGEMKDGGKER